MAGPEVNYAADCGVRRSHPGVELGGEGEAVYDFAISARLTTFCGSLRKTIDVVTAP